MHKVLFLIPLFTATVLCAGLVKTIDFENESEGIYTVEQMKASWNNPSWDDGVSEGRCHIINDPAGVRGKVLRVLYPKGGVGPSQGGAQWKMNFNQSYDTLYVSYYVMLPADFDRIQGGKLPGLAGGTAPTGGKVSDGTDGFSARIMWRNRNTADGTQSAICQYMYYMESTNTWGEDFFWAYPNPTRSSTRRYLVHGQWHNLKTRIIMNTPGTRNGRVTSWLDGELALDSAVMLRAEGADFGIDLFYFSTFFGGSDSTWAPSKDEYIYFDHFVFSTLDIPTDPVFSRKLSGKNLKTTPIKIIGRGEKSSVLLKIQSDICGYGNLKLFTVNGTQLGSFTIKPSGMLNLNVGENVSPGIYYAVFDGVKFQDRLRFTILK